MASDSESQEPLLLSGSTDEEVTQNQKINENNDEDDANDAMHTYIPQQKTPFLSKRKYL